MDLKIEGSILEQGIFNMSGQKPPIPAKKVSNHKVFGTDQETFSDMNMRGVGSSTNTSFSNVFEHSENDQNSIIPVDNKENPYAYQNGINH